MAPDMPSFFTTEKADVSNRLWAVTSAVGTGLCFLALVVIAALYTHPTSKTHFDRVSFRLMLYSLIANFLFGIFSVVGGLLTGPSVSCGLSVFLLQLTLELSSFLLFCIGLNLQLVVVHDIRSKRLERYYIACSMAMALIVTVPPYAAGQYGWDPLDKDCWYTSTNHQQRLAWQIGTQFIWTGLTVMGEVATACTVTIYMLRLQYRRKRILSCNSPSRSTSSSCPQSEGHLRNRVSMASLKSMPKHVCTYTNVILRIALYPFVSCVINLTMIGSVIPATSADGIRNANDYRILLLSDFTYGGRAIVYALLAVTDPALIRAARALLASRIKWSLSSCVRLRSPSSRVARPIHQRGHGDLVVQVELTTVKESDYAPGESRIDHSDVAKSRDIEVGIKSADPGSVGDPVVAFGETAKGPDTRRNAEFDERASRSSGVHTMPRSSVAVQLASPISPTQSLRRRWERMAREQVEGREFMKIL